MFATTADPSFAFVYLAGQPALLAIVLSGVYPLKVYAPISSVKQQDPFSVAASYVVVGD
jgi:hypothetical protein